MRRFSVFGPLNGRELTSFSHLVFPILAPCGVCKALSKPVNFMTGIKGKSFSVVELATAGVKHISLATWLYRAAMTRFLEAASEVKNSGQFDFLDQCASITELLKLTRI